MPSDDGSENPALNFRSRREFIETVSAALGAAGISACGGNSGPTDAQPTSENIESIINGSAEPFRIQTLGGFIDRMYDGSSSVGAQEYTWLRSVTNHRLEQSAFLATGPTLEYRIGIPGEHTITLRVQGNTTTDEAKITFSVSPPPLPEQAFDVPMAFFRYEEPSPLLQVPDPIVPALYLMGTNSPQDIVRIAGNNGFNTNTTSWEPNGNRIIFSILRGARGARVHSYNTQTNELTELTNNDGIAWMATVSPDGEWIAYVDDTRTERNRHDELTLIRPDGSELIRLYDPEDQDAWGFYPTWDPTGTRIAIGNNRFNVSSSGALMSTTPNTEPISGLFPYDKAMLLRRDVSRTRNADFERVRRSLQAGDVELERIREALSMPNYASGATEVRRIAIYELSSDKRSVVERRALHTEKQIQDFLRTTYDDGEELFNVRYPTIRVGINGVSWSPDGEWIVFNMNFGFDDGLDDSYRNMLARSRADGSAEIERVAEHNASNPSFSADGTRFFLTRPAGLGFNVYSALSTGGQEVNLSLLSRPEGSTKTLDDVAPAVYQ